MKNLICIQARMNSSRLPKKSMLPIEGIPLIEHLFQAVLSIKPANSLMLLTTDTEEAVPLCELATSLNIDVYRGDEDNVASRFFHIAKISDVDWITRICGDSPLFDPRVILEAERVASCGRSDIVSSAYGESRAPSGMHVEMIRREVMLMDYPNFESEVEKEHVTRYWLDHPERRRINGLQLDLASTDGLKFSVDTKDDLHRIKKLFSTFTKAHYEYTLNEKIQIFRDLSLES